MSYNLNFTDEGFDNILLQNEKNIVHLRTNAFDDEEAWRWKEVLTKHNNITFNVQRLYHGVRYRFHEKFICLHGDKLHKGVKKTYTGCSVKMHIKIKLITKATCNKDKDVKKHPCIVKIEGVHNHSTEAASALQELRIPTETIDTFSKYFDLGMTVPQAMRFHQEKHNFNLSDLANAAVNPKRNSVYHISEKWLKNNRGTLGSGDVFPSTSEKSKNVNSDSHLAETWENSQENNHPGKLKVKEVIDYIIKEEHDISDEENKDLYGVETQVKTNFDLHEMSCNVKEENIHDEINDIVKEEHDVDYSMKWFIKKILEKCNYFKKSFKKFCNPETSFELK